MKSPGISLPKSYLFGGPIGRVFGRYILTRKYIHFRCYPPRNLQQDPLFTDPEKTWVSNSSVSQLTERGTVGFGPYLNFDGYPYNFFSRTASGIYQLVIETLPLQVFLGWNPLVGGWAPSGCKRLGYNPHLYLVGGCNPFPKYARQIGSFPQVGVKIKNIWNHHLDTPWKFNSKSPWK